MSNVISFTPKAEIGAKEEVKRFINFCRKKLITSDSGFDFDSNTWDPSKYIKPRLRKAEKIKFSNWGQSHNIEDGKANEIFLNFSKSYILHSLSMAPTVNLFNKTKALQAIEYSAKELFGDTHPSLINSQILYNAMRIVGERYSQSTASSIGSEMVSLIKFMRKKKLLAAPFTWKNPITHPKHNTRIGKEFDEARNKKLPSPEALEAIAKIFTQATEPSEIIVSSACAILCSAPDRICEVLLLPELCVVHDKPPNADQMITGLRWFPAKGGTPMIKWTVPIMADVLERAINNIRSATQSGRQLAKWYEENPKKLFLPKELEHHRHSDMLTMKEVHQIVFDTDCPSGNGGGVWCRTHKLPIKKIGMYSFLAFKDLEKHLLGLIPKSFPIADHLTEMRYSEMLFITQRNELDKQKGTYRCMFASVSFGNIARRLSGKTVSNIFLTHGYTDKHGAPLKIPTHQLRHHINTLAQAGGLGQIDIAIWSGRASIEQNIAYDHVSGTDLLAIAENMTKERDKSSHTPNTRSYSLIPRQEWLKLGIEAGHTTEFGYCLHDFSMLPCQLHIDCINCEEHVCVKGDCEREASIRKNRNETSALLKAAKLSFQNGDFGANRWVDHQTLTLQRLDQLCDILDDPKVPPGSAIRLSCISPPSELLQSSEQTKKCKIGSLRSPKSSSDQQHN